MYKTTFRNKVLFVQICQWWQDWETWSSWLLKKVLKFLNRTELREWMFYLRVNLMWQLGNKFSVDDWNCHLQHISSHRSFQFYVHKNIIYLPCLEPVSLLFFFPLFGSTENWTQALGIALPLKPCSTPLCFSYFSGRVLHFCLGLVSDYSFLTHVSCITGITGLTWALAKFLPG
jgi:hypothetical protein